MQSQVSPEEWQCVSIWLPRIAWSRCLAGTTWSSPHLGPRARSRAPLPDQSVWDDVRRDHGVDLVRIDLDGRKVTDSPFEVNRLASRFTAIHAVRADAMCVLHVHSINGIAVSAHAGVLPISQQSIFVLSSLAYHDYEGIALNADEKPRLVRDLGDRHFLMLRNHGLLTLAERCPMRS
jgi:ribulose-5-phosphate 4-epimerase/fuculose-1-phosphate aldolase